MQAPPDASDAPALCAGRGSLAAGAMPGSTTAPGSESCSAMPGRFFLEGSLSTLDAFVRPASGPRPRACRSLWSTTGGEGRGCGGVLVWQLNEPWPAISWALIDFYRQPKPAYDVVKRLFSPLLVSVEYALKSYQPGDDLSGTVWLVNDRGEAMRGCDVEVVLWDGQGRQVERWAQTADLAAYSAVSTGSLRWTLPPGGGWQLTCCLAQDGRILSSNEYDLTAYDGLGPSPWQRFWAWLTGLVTPT